MQFPLPRFTSSLQSISIRITVSTVPPKLGLLKSPINFLPHHFPLLKCLGWQAYSSLLFSFSINIYFSLGHLIKFFFSFFNVADVLKFVFYSSYLCRTLNLCPIANVGTNCTQMSSKDFKVNTFKTNLFIFFSPSIYFSPGLPLGQ